MSKITLALVSGLVVGSFGVGAFAWADNGTDDSRVPPPEQHVIPQPEGMTFDKSKREDPRINEHGLSVGQMYVGEPLPDLVPTEGGYLRPSEYLLPPGGAGAEQRRPVGVEHRANGDVYANLYASDGVTVIGKVLIGNVTNE